MIDFKLPDIGEGLQDAEIIKWRVNVGDAVKVDQILVEIETDKAVVEVPSPYEGKIARLYGQPGDTIKVGSPLVSFEIGADFEEAESQATEETSRDGGTVVGKLESGTKILNESPRGVTKSKSKDSRIKVTPAVRKLAAELNIDLNRVSPSGPNGTITRQDIEISAQSSEPPPSSPGSGQTKGEPLKRARRSMAKNMAAAHSQVALVTIMDNADITHWGEKEDVTVRMVYAISSACYAEPALNVFYNHEDQSIVKNSAVHLGIAVDTPDGLYVPVIKNADKRSSSVIRDHIETFKKKAREKSFQSEDLRGGTIILSNYGGIGGRYATPMVVPPMVAIVGVGATYQELALVVKQPVNRLKLPISLSFDHRAVTGGEAARFLKAMITNLQR